MADQSTNGILLALGAFALGSIPFGFIAGRIMGKDLRELGSKNIGATNALRVLGTGPGIAVFILDALKGLAPVETAKALQFTPEWIVGIGMAAMLGHIFSPFLKFKGGKGVATGLGVVIGLSPIASAIAFGIFVLTVAMTRYVSLGSMLGAIVMSIMLIVLKAPLPYSCFGILATAFVIFRHKDNIKRILNGTENRFGEKKKPQDA